LSFKDRWAKELNRLLTDEEKKEFSLWLEVAKGKISEPDFQAKMNVNVMPKVLGKLSAARMNALEDEVESLRKRVAALEKNKK
jgi:polyhydroxyalkanoate synthesis regulator phasin